MKRGKLTCVECGKSTTYKIEKERCTCGVCAHSHGEIVYSEDKRRVQAKLCPRCFKAELKQLLFDEIGGILGNLEYLGEETLVALAKALVYHGKTRFYKASEYLVFRALKDNQNPEEDILMMPDGDKSTLRRKL